MPLSIIKYTENSHGVDVLDQCVGYNLFGNRSVRWYFRIILFLLEVASLNSWVIFRHAKKNTPLEEIQYYVYRRKLTKQMIDQWKISHNIPQTPVKIKNKAKERRKIEVSNHADQLIGDCHLGNTS